MVLTKDVLINQITIAENATILVQEVTSIKENGVEISKQIHRSSFEKGSDVSNQPQQLQDICAIAWRG